MTATQPPDGTRPPPDLLRGSAELEAARLARRAAGLPLVPPAHHLLAEPGDHRTLCGLDTRTKASMPHLLARYVPQHREGHQRAGRAFTVCPDCGGRWHSALTSVLGELAAEPPSSEGTH